MWIPLTFNLDLEKEIKKEPLDFCEPEVSSTPEK